MSRKFALAAVVLSTLCSFGPAMAADEANVAPGLTYGGAPLGLHGADPVALLDDATNAEGNASFAAAHDGVAYYFASEANMNSSPRRSSGGMKGLSPDLRISSVEFYSFGCIVPMGTDLWDACSMKESS